MDRHRLVERVRSEIETQGWPRVVVFLIVTLSGICGFLVSYALLSAGMGSMPLRYGLAGASAYLMFLALLAVYIRLRRSDEGLVEGRDGVDFFNGVDATADGGEAVARFAGGRSGGGGASAAWGEPSHAASTGRGSWFDGDLDVGWVLVAIAAVLAGAIAVTYVIWVAPALLAEVLVDAAIVSTVSRHVNRLERRDWTATAIRRTWIPAAVMIITLVIGGWALQQIAPEAKSIGPALRSVSN